MEEQNPKDIDPFPWELGIFDAHCHPTDTMTSTSDIPRMRTTALTIMSTRGEDQDLVHEVAQRLGDYHNREDSALHTNSGKVIPCFGWHPWFAHQISIQDSRDKTQHYRNVLIGSLPQEGEDDVFFHTLPNPKPLSVLLAETKKRLLAHPNALVGEVGLDKAFRLPMPWQEHEIEAREAGLTPGSREGRRLSPYRVTLVHQKALLKAQFQLAGQLRRAVSVHSVQAHGAVFDVLQELFKGHERKAENKRQRKQRMLEEKYISLTGEEEDDNNNNHIEEDNNEADQVPLPLPYPPRICMHSYSGPPETLKQFLRPTVPSNIYFSFSTAINFTTPAVDRVIASIQLLPDDRILVESDLHCAGQQMDDLLEEVVRTICRLRGWSLEDGINILAENWKRFVFG